MDTSHRKMLGRAGEDFAFDVVERAGLRVRERNWRDGRRGELDLIAEDPHGGVVIIEVRTRVGDRCGTPLESVDQRKMMRLRGLAAAWARAHQYRGRLRIDVIALSIPHTAKEKLRAQFTDGEVDLSLLGTRLVWMEALQ